MRLPTAAVQAGSAVVLAAWTWVTSLAISLAADLAVDLAALAAVLPPAPPMHPARAMIFRPA